MSARLPRPSAAYSYLRFSKGEQSSGDSIRRQTDLRLNWLKRHPHVRLDTTLTFEDRGVSGFKGRHRTDGALGEFLRLVQASRIPRGSYLLIESVDRLTREEFEVAVPMVISLIHAGISVVSLSPTELVFEPGMDDSRKMMLVFELSRSHGESARKSAMLGAMWESKRESARMSKTPIGRQAPYWVVPVNDRGESVRSGERVAGYRLDPEAARAVRKIFRLAIAGRSSNAIALQFNSEQVPAIGKAPEWRGAYVLKIIQNRAAVGEYQPRRNRQPDGEPIAGFYPAVVDRATFDRANRSVVGNRSRAPGRRAARHLHPFAGLLVDAVDRCPMYVRTKKGQQDQLISAAAYQKRPGAAPWRLFPLVVLVDALLGRLEELGASDLFADDAGGKVADLEGRLADVKRLLERAEAKYEADPDSPFWVGQVDKHDREQRRLTAELKAARLEAESPASANWNEAVELIRRREPERLRAALSRCVDQVSVLVVKKPRGRLAACQVHFRGGGRRSYLIVYVPGYKLPHKQVPDQVRVLSFAEAVAKPDQLDLRDSENVAELAKALGSLDIDAIFADAPQPTAEPAKPTRRKPR
jgi:DNA invertase Pin-like site-specific DNA recombinase